MPRRMRLTRLRASLPMLLFVGTAACSAPPAPAGATVVRRVFPSAEVWPANLRRLYVEFNSPMASGDHFTHLHLLDEAGAEVPEAFLPHSAASWNVDRTRFTARLNPQVALSVGRRYTVVVDAVWPDGQLLSLKSGYRREFRVGPPDTTAINPATWAIAGPKAGSRDDVVVRFGESLDRLSLMRGVGLAGPDGLPLEVDIRIEAAESELRFSADEGWPAGDFRLVVLEDLEDLGGNSVGRLHDPATEAQPPSAEPPRRYLPITIR